MKKWNGWLDDIGYVFKGVMFIPNGGDYGTYLFESDWNEIDSTIKDML